MKKLKAAIIITPFVFVLFVGVLLYFGFKVNENESNDIAKYQQLSETYSFLPSIDEIGEYEELNFKYLYRDHFIFHSDAYTLRASYNDAEFFEQADLIDEKFTFQKTVIDRGKQKEEKETDFKLDGFDFKMLSLEAYDLSYPKKMVFIGVSEEAREIVYIFFDDIDLDYIGQPFQDFLREYCGWK